MKKIIATIALFVAMSAASATNVKTEVFDYEGLSAVAQEGAWQYEMKQINCKGTTRHKNGRGQYWYAQEDSVSLRTKTHIQTGEKHTVTKTYRQAEFDKFKQQHPSLYNAYQNYCKQYKK